MYIKYAMDRVEGKGDSFQARLKKECQALEDIRWPDTALKDVKGLVDRIYSALDVVGNEFKQSGSLGLLADINSLICSVTR